MKSEQPTDVPADCLQTPDIGSNGHTPVGIHNTALDTDIQDITGLEQDVPTGQAQAPDAR
ncbi:1235_t:CDS:2, partial [Paraglomus occultum]